MFLFYYSYKISVKLLAMMMWCVVFIEATLEHSKELARQLDRLYWTFFLIYAARVSIWDSFFVRNNQLPHETHSEVRHVGPSVKVADVDLRVKGNRSGS